MKRFSGRIGYYGSGGTPTGYEDFAVELRSDGSRSLHAHCVMDDRTLVRICALSLDGRNRPVAASVRTEQGGLLLGSGAYRFEGDRISATLTDAAKGERHTERTATASFFGTHSLINDAWLSLLGAGMTPGESRALTGLYACSLDADGGGAPDLLESSATLTRIDARTLDLPSGTEDCAGWSVAYGDYPPIDMWLTADGLLAHMAWSHLEGFYRLDALSVG